MSTTDIWKYDPPEWAVQQVLRSDLPWRLLEDICKHGVGHPNQVWLAKHDPDGSRCYGVHGCDGCCCIAIVCEVCGGSGILQQTYTVTHDMAIHAGDRTLEGQPYPVKERCIECGGVGVI